MITFYIDELTPCLKDTSTGDFIDTEVVRITRKSFLSKFNRKTGWYINWSKLPKDVEIYALVIKGTTDIQGLIGIKNDIHADAMDSTILNHYIDMFDAWGMPLSGHPLHFVVEETAAQKIREVYTYEWTSDEL